MTSIDDIALSFDAAGLRVLGIALGVVMFGIALDMKVSDFTRLLRDPKAPLIGLCCQFLVLPPLAFLLARAVAPTPSMALGMILVAACPGGNVSNWLTHYGGGRTEVSVGMTAVSTVAAVVTTPAHLALWGSFDPATAALLADVSLDPLQMGANVAILLGIPVILGMGTARWLPRVAAFLRRPMAVLSFVFFAGVVVAAFSANLDAFVAAIRVVFWPVLVLNAAALALGYGAAALAGLPEPDRRAVCIEVGIQNSGLGLVLIFGFFGGLGGMAVVAGWWGIWHILAGLAVTSVWRWRDRRARRAVAG